MDNINYLISVPAPLSSEETLNRVTNSLTQLQELSLTPNQQANAYEVICSTYAMFIQSRLKHSQRVQTIEPNIQDSIHQIEMRFLTLISIDEQIQLIDLQLKKMPRPNQHAWETLINAYQWPQESHPIIDCHQFEKKISYFTIFLKRYSQISKTKPMPPIQHQFEALLPRLLQQLPDCFHQQKQQLCKLTPPLHKHEGFRKLSFLLTTFEHFFNPDMPSQQSQTPPLLILFTFFCHSQKSQFWVSFFDRHPKFQRRLNQELTRYQKQSSNTAFEYQVYTHYSLQTATQYKPKIQKEYNPKLKFFFAHLNRLCQENPLFQYQNRLRKQLNHCITTMTQDPKKAKQIGLTIKAQLPLLMQPYWLNLLCSFNSTQYSISKIKEKIFKLNLHLNDTLCWLKESPTHDYKYIQAFINLSKETLQQYDHIQLGRQGPILHSFWTTIIANFDTLFPSVLYYEHPNNPKNRFYDFIQEKIGAQQNKPMEHKLQWLIKHLPLLNPHKSHPPRLRKHRLIK
tara:strand:+ start:631 stop:2163 length:1533 start_codon:yes stop_codon:yes gene_type:complete